MFQAVSHPGPVEGSDERHWAQLLIDDDWVNVLGCGAILPPQGEAQRFHSGDEWGDERRMER